MKRTRPSSVGPLAITTFPVITTQVSETDFRATSAAIGRATSEAATARSDQKAGNPHRSFIGEPLIFSITVSSAIPSDRSQLQRRQLLEAA